MSKKFEYDHFKKKPKDCILYSEDGTSFKIHKELLGHLHQTDFFRKMLISTKDCDQPNITKVAPKMIEIICPCSKEDLAKLVHFLYQGEIQCDDVFDSLKSQEDLSKILGFPESLNIECQIATLLDDPALSSIIDHIALNEELVTVVDDEITTQSNIDFNNNDDTELNTENVAKINIALVPESVPNEETSENIGDEFNTIIKSKMVDKSSQTEVEIDWNNNLVDEMEVPAINEEPFENTLDESISNNVLFNGSLLNAIDFVGQYETEETLPQEQEHQLNNDDMNQVLRNFPHKCNQCNFSTKSERNLKRHVKAAHLKNCPYSCKYCYYSCRSKQRIEMHVNEVHLKIKPFFCQYCDKSFSRKPDAKRHIESIHFQKKHFCSYCEKAFSQKTAVNRHIKEKHLNRGHHKNHVCNLCCNLCRISFIHKSHLTQHISELHKNSKPLKCVKPELKGPLVFLKKVEFPEE